MTAKETTLPPSSEQKKAGTCLQHLRLEQNLELEEVVAATKISLSNLRAIESMEYTKLPADIFVKALVTQYGVFLGADGVKIAEQFFFERDGGKKKSHHINQSLRNKSFSPKILAEPSHVSSATIAFIILFLIIMSFTAFCLYTSWNPFAFISDKTQSLTSSVASTFHPADPATGNGKVQSPLTVDLRFVQDVQVSVALDNQDPVQYAFEKDKSVRWVAEKKVRIIFPLQDSAEITVNGKVVQFPQAKDGMFILDLPAAVP